MVVASKSAVCEDSGEAGMQVCCSWPPVGDWDCGRALCGCWGTRVMVVPTQVGQSHVSYLLWLLKVIEERSHEGFGAEGARTPARGLTARAHGCSWHGACWLAKPSISGLPKPWGGGTVGPCTAVVHVPAPPDLCEDGRAPSCLVLAPTTPIHPSRDLPCWQQVDKDQSWCRLMELLSQV